MLRPHCGVLRSRRILLTSKLNLGNKNSPSQLQSLSHGIRSPGVQQENRIWRQQTKAASNKDDFDRTVISFGDTAGLVIRHLWPRDTADKLRMLVTLFSIGVGKYLGLKAPQVYGDLTNKLSEVSTTAESDSEDARQVYKLLINYAASKFSAHALNELRSGVFTTVTARAVMQASAEAFQALQESDVDFIQSMKSGEVSSLLDKSSKALGAMMHNCVIRFVPMTIELAMLTRKLSKQQKARLNWITWTTLSTYIIATLGYSSTRVQHRLANNRAENKLRGAVQESLLNSEVSRLLGTSKFELDKYRSVYRSVYDTAIAVGTSLSKLNFMQQLILQTGSLAAVAASVNRVFLREARVGELVAVASTFSQVAGSLHFLGTMYREFRTNYVEVQKLQKLMNLRRTIQDSPQAKPLLINRGTVEFRDVTFKYPTANTACIKDLSMRIPGGSRVAIVGPSGCGKSTLVKLLTRLYDTDHGQISVCVQDVRGVTLDSLRSQIGIVPQDIVLFNDTIKNNILYGNWDASNDEIAEALRVSQLEAVVAALPQGLDSLMGERGNRLSGGERQRVALARCLLRRPRILVLDEATSNIDIRSESEIMDSVKQLARGKTIIVIAHRLQAIVDSEQIFFMEKGRIIEQGTHEELLKMSGGYAAMWYEQQRKSAEDDFNPIKKISSSDQLSTTNSFVSVA